MTDEQLVERLRHHMFEVGVSRVHQAQMVEWARAYLSSDRPAAQACIGRLVRVGLLVEHPQEVIPTTAGPGWPSPEAQPSYSLPPADR